LYDFHIGKVKHKAICPGGAFVLINSQPAMLINGSHSIESATERDIDESDGEKYLVVQVGEDRIVLDRQKLNQGNVDGWTPLHSCCHTLNTVDAGHKILLELMKQGYSSSDLNLKTSRGPGSFSSEWTPLHIACKRLFHSLECKFSTCMILQHRCIWH